MTQDVVYSARTILYRCPLCNSEPLELTKVGQKCMDCEFEHELESDVLKLLEEREYFASKRSSWRD